MVHRLAVLRAGALGDTLLALPVIHALRARYPGVRLTAVGNRENWSVAGPLVDEIRSIDAPPFTGLVAGAPTPALFGWLRDIDLLVIWSARPPSPALRDAGLPLLHASPYPPPGIHAAAWLLETLAPLDLPAFPPLPWPALLRLSAEELEWGERALAAGNLRRPILLHPGAGAAWKRWPADRFARLALDLRARGEQIALIEGPADEGAVAAVQAPLDIPLPVIREPSPRRLAAILAGCRAAVGNDSGVAHLAALAGTPTVALVGPTDPISWAPLGNVRVLRHCAARTSQQGEIRVCASPECLSSIAVEEVTDAVLSLIGGSSLIRNPVGTGEGASIVASTPTRQMFSAEQPAGTNTPPRPSQCVSLRDRSIRSKMP